MNTIAGMKSLVKDIKDNWIADIAFLATGALFGFGIKFIVENIQKLF